MGINNEELVPPNKDLSVMSLLSSIAHGQRGPKGDQGDPATQEQVDQAVASMIDEPVANATSAWLSEHVDPATGYVVDKSLTIEDAAADSKAVGDQFDLFDMAKVNKTALYNETTASGNPLSVETGSVQTVISTKIDMEPIQDLHGYDNPWPAGGGKNKYNSAETEFQSGLLDDDGNYQYSGASHYTLNFTKVEANTTYTYSGTITTTNTKGRIYFYDENKNWISRTSTFGDVTSYTFTTPSGCGYIRIQSANEIDGSDWQIEKGSSPTTYVPYSNICPITGRQSVSLYNDSKYAGLVDWNQGCEVKNSDTINRVTFTSNGDGSYTVDGTAEDDARFIINLSYLKANRQRAIYYLTGCPNGGSVNTFYVGGRFIWKNTYNTDTGEGKIINDNESLQYSDSLSIVVKAGTSVQNLTFNPQVFNLTEIFGSEIANQIYAMEQAEAGAGIAYFRNLFPNDYYAYNAGTEMTVDEVNTGTASYKLTVQFPALGKNQFNPQKLVHNSVRSLNNGGGLSDTNNAFRTAICEQLKVGTYTFSTDLSNCYIVRIQIGGSTTGVGEGTITEINTETQSYTFTLSADSFVMLAFRNTSTTEITGEPKVQIEQGSSPTPYEPYTNTVYGGTLDLTSGVLTVDMGYVDLGTRNWTTAGSGRHNTSCPSGMKIVPNTKVTNSICSEYRAYSGGTIVSNDMSFGVINERDIQINDSRLNGIDASDFKTAMNGVQLVYELATPTTIQLTPEEVQLLKGNNTIWTDGDSIKLTYINDTESIADVDNRITQVLGDIAPIEGATASTNYSVGAYMIFDGKFCKVTTAIATGEAIAIGTNVTQTTVAAELQTIFAQLH